ncbi:MAG: hypothetical protein JNJ54_24045 [Myxococcaceae bacterium]|nr:hypothetical protein [Myxococcaceae bacterium]
MRLEPVWEPLTVETVTTALAKRDIVPRAARPHPTFAIRAQHVPSAVKLDLELAETLSPDLKRQLDETLGAGWASRRPAPARLRRAPKRERRSPQKRMPNTPRRA